MTDQVKNLLGSLMFGGLLIAATIKFYNKDINVNLSKVDRITGVVTSSGVTEKSSLSGGRHKMKSLVFFVTLSNSTQLFAIYRPSQDYTVLSDNLREGDTVTIFYRKQQDSDLNLDVYQIEKRGQILQDYKSYNNNVRKLSWFTGILGVGMIGAGVWQYFRRKG